MSHKIARLLLDFQARQSVCGGERNATMDAQMLEATLKVHIKGMRERLDQTAAIARAADACADIGNLKKAVEIANDVEQLIYELNTLLNAASLMNRIYRT